MQNIERGNFRGLIQGTKRDWCNLFDVRGMNVILKPAEGETGGST